MDDIKIIELFFARSEHALKETQLRYGKVLYRIAHNILCSREDSEETVNDTYIKAWDTIPPQRPGFLGAYLGRITRNLAINRYYSLRAKKRYSGARVLLDELQECIPASQTVESALEERELVRVIDGWLGSLQEEDRALFLRRYWFADPVKDLARSEGISENQMAGRLFRLRQSLKKALEKEGIVL